MKVYIASPFFNDEELNRVKIMENFLESKGYEVYSPQRDGGILSKDATQEERLKVFEENVEHVYDCDLMIVIVATKDTGTSVEVGLKYGQWKSERDYLTEIKFNDPNLLSTHEKAVLNQQTPRMISFADNGTELNVMLLGAVLKHCKSWSELSEYLEYVDNVGIDNATRDKDSITDIEVY